MSAPTPAKRPAKTDTIRRTARVSTERPVARFRMRITSAQTIAVGPGKIALLEAIRQTRSITAAAKAMDMSYRRAWMLVDELNAALKRPAVRSAIGGERGGGSELTEVGESLVALYRRIEDGAARACAEDIKAMLKLLR
jgi:molybdate transport system regulatory protein